VHARRPSARAGRTLPPPALLCLFFLNGYPSRPYIQVHGESPRVVESIARKIHLLIGKGAVNVPTHHHSAILNNLLPCFLPALGNHLKHSFEDALCPYSVNSLLHILKIQQLVICVPSALHWTVCVVWAKSSVRHNHRQKNLSSSVSSTNLLLANLNSSSLSDRVIALITPAQEWVVSHLTNLNDVLYLYFHISDNLMIYTLCRCLHSLAD